MTEKIGTNDNFERGIYKVPSLCHLTLSFSCRVKEADISQTTKVFDCASQIFKMCVLCTVFYAYIFGDPLLVM